MTFQLMQAPKVVLDLAELEPLLPLYVSEKLDGIRAAMWRGRAITRELLPVPNEHIRHLMETQLLDGIDGELVAGDFNETQSAVMSRFGSPDFKFHVFDFFGPGTWKLGWEERMQRLGSCYTPFVCFVPQVLVHTLGELVAACQAHVDAGCEGSMVRAPKGRYHHGRVSTSDAIIYKVKQRDDEEAVILGYAAKQVNKNPQVRGLKGEQERCTRAEGMVEVAELGSLHCKFADGTEFDVGSGLTADDRVKLWLRRDELIGVTLPIEFALPRKGKPRFPTITYASRARLGLC